MLKYSLKQTNFFIPTSLFPSFLSYKVVMKTAPRNSCLYHKYSNLYCSQLKIWLVWV